MSFTKTEIRKIALAAPITGFVSGAGVVTSADTVETAIEKLNGNAVAASGGVISNAPLPRQTKILAKTYDGNNLIVDGNVINKLSALNRFSPLDISSLVGWWDFTDATAIALTGVNVNQVTDKSTAANNLVQATVGSQPLYTTFGGTSDYGFASFSSGKTLAKTVAVNQPYTVFMVVKIKSFIDAGRVMEFAGGTTNGITQKTNPVDTLSKKCFGPVANTGWQLAHFYYLGDTIIVGWNVNGTATKRVFENMVGSNATDEVSNPGTGATTYISIGGATSPNFDMYEVLFFNAGLTDTQLKQVDFYLHSKYEVSEKPRILSIGDSLTAGAGSLNSAAGFVHRVAFYKDLIYQYQSVSGGTVNATLRPRHRTYTLGNFKNIWITICFGTNEGNVDATWNTNYTVVVENLIRDGFMPARIILVTPPYHSSRATRLTAIQGYLSAIAATYGCSYADCVTPTLAGGGDALLPDGTHPNNAGHELMAQAITAVMI